MTLNIYLNFNGNCREVFEFYRSIFGGEFQIMETFGNGPPDMGVPEDERDNIMHVSYPIGSSVLMGSDMPSNFGAASDMGNNFSISYSTSSKEETRRPVRQDVGGGHGDDGSRRHVLGIVLWGVRR